MDSQDVLVVAANNLRLGDNALEVGASRATSMGQRNDELPKSVIVTNVGLSVFDDEQTKVSGNFQQLLCRSRSPPFPSLPACLPGCRTRRFGALNLWSAAIQLLGTILLQKSRPIWDSMQRGG